MAAIDFSFAIRNYKSFGDQFVGLDGLKPINLIIGRNNSGKTALLDLVAALCRKSPAVSAMHVPRGKEARFQLSATISEAAARQVFLDNVTGRIGGRGSHWVVAGQHYVGKRLVWQQPSGGQANSRTVEQSRADVGAEDWQPAYADTRSRFEFENQIAQILTNPLEGKAFRRIAAERDVYPEQNDANEESCIPQPNGVHITNLIQRIYSQSTYDDRIVKVEFLRELNSIVQPDFEFKGKRSGKHVVTRA